MQDRIAAPAGRPVATTTAGLRGTHRDPAERPAGHAITVHASRTHGGATGGASVLDSEADRLAVRSAATDLKRHDLPGTIHGRPVAPGEPDGQERAAQIPSDRRSTRRLPGGPAA